MGKAEKVRKNMIMNLGASNGGHQRRGRQRKIGGEEKEKGNLVTPTANLGINLCTYYLN